MPYCVIHDVRVKANKDVIRSRVFVSYGQRNEEEKMVATEIEIRLTELGYDPYVAIHKALGL